MSKISYHRIDFQIKISILRFFLYLMVLDGILSPKIKTLESFPAIYINI